MLWLWRTIDRCTFKYFNAKNIEYFSGEGEGVEIVQSQSTYTHTVTPLTPEYLSKTGLSNTRLQDELKMWYRCATTARTKPSGLRCCRRRSGIYDCMRRAPISGTLALYGIGSEAIPVALLAAYVCVIIVLYICNCASPTSISTTLHIQIGNFVTFLNQY